jgi:uncharacterized membrane protein (DUF485 family)
MSAVTPRNPATAASSRGAADEALRVARARRMAWALGLIVIACYVGFMVLTGIKGPL